MASNLRVDQITASTTGSVSIGTATFTGGLSGDITGLNVTGVITATTLNQNVTGVVTATGGFVVGTGATISGSTNTITASTNGSERVRINSSGNVGIGTDNPTVFGTAYRTLQLNPAAGTGDGSAIRFMYDGGTANTNDLVIYTNSSQSYIRANGARNLDIMRNGSTVATFNANGIALPSGLGIDFSATSNAAGATSELLSDYEEGTWTPVFIDYNDGNPMYANNELTIYHATYTKVNNLIFVSCYIANDASFSYAAGKNGTQYLGIGGLPFNVIGSSAGYYPIYVGFFQSWTQWDTNNYGYNPMGYFYSAFDRIIFTYPTTNGVNNIPGSSLAASNSSIILSGYYRTS
jgi:hypothetical protein